VREFRYQRTVYFSEVLEEVEEGPALESTEETEGPEVFPGEVVAEVGPRKLERCLVQVAPGRTVLQ
jgi:hypothetical protein